MKSELVEELNREACLEERIETRIKTRQESLIDFATEKWGDSPRIALEISAIDDAERLKRLQRAIVHADSLDELLATN